MPREPRVSVIVPVYNARETIEECISSLLALAFGSCPEVCRKYEKGVFSRCFHNPSTGWGQ